MPKSMPPIDTNKAPIKAFLTFLRSSNTKRFCKKKLTSIPQEAEKRCAEVCVMPSQCVRMP